MNTTSRRGLALALALLLGLSILTSCGENNPSSENEQEQEQEPTVILESENYQISAEEFKVYQYQAGMLYLTTQYWYYQYGLLNDSDKILEKYKNSTDYVLTLLPEEIEKNAFVSTAYTDAEKYIVYCEGALAAGADQKLKSKVTADVDEYITSLKELAKTQDLSLKAYIQKYMGKSVKEADVRSAIEKYILAEEYAESKTIDLSNAITDEEMTQYVAENPEQFYKTYYCSYQFSDPALCGILKEAYAPEILITLLNEYVLDQTYDSSYQNHIIDKSIEDPYGKDHTRSMVGKTVLSLVGVQNPENGETYSQYFTETSTSEYGQAAYQITQTVCNKLNQAINQINSHASIPYVDLSDADAYASASILEKYLLFESRKEGDFTVVEHSDGSYEWLLVSKVMALDEEETRNVSYVKFSDEKDYTAEEKANAFLYAFLDNKSPENFDALAVQLEIIESDLSAMHECVTRASITSLSPSLALWLYDGVRAVGDAAVIQDGDDYYVAYYALENEANWRMQARDDLTEIHLQEWFDQTLQEINIETHIDTSELKT